MARLGWIHRALLSGGTAALVLGGALGCDSKDSGIPSSPPLAASEPDQILLHLKYLAVRRDLRHIVVIAPISPDVVFPSSWWFHKHATDLKIDLSPEEMQSLAITELQARLPNLPRSEEKGYGIEEARKAFNAGLYRLLKGIPQEAWNDVRVSEVKMNGSNTRVMDVFLAYNGKQIMQVSCLKKADGYYGVSFIRYLQVPSGVFKAPAKK